MCRILIGQPAVGNDITKLERLYLLKIWENTHNNINTNVGQYIRFHLLIPSLGVSAISRTSINR